MLAQQALSTTGVDVRPVDWLISRTASFLCALQLGQVVETMRPLPVRRLAHAPAFVRGVSVIRGEPLPVLDLGMLLGDAKVSVGRFVTIKFGEEGRRAALAVGEVLGIRPIIAAQATAMPPVLRDTDADLVTAIGTLDADLLLFLKTARLVPEEVWRELAQEAQTS